MLELRILRPLSDSELKKTLIPVTNKKKYINFGARRILRPLSCTEFNSTQGDGHGLGVSHGISHTHSPRAVGKIRFLLLGLEPGVVLLLETQYFRYFLLLLKPYLVDITSNISVFSD